MVMDVYDHISPKSTHPDDIYILELYADRDFFSFEKLYGVFDCLETAMHSLNYITMFKFHDLNLEQSLLISRVRKNKINICKMNLISWQRKEGEDKDKNNRSIPGTTSGKFSLHDEGLRTHKIE